MSYSDLFKEIEFHYQSKEKSNFSFNNKSFFYIVPMFPYPSGNIHMGHVRNYTISNVYTRYKKKKGFNVLHPIGFDSFGLPAEGASFKNNMTPKEWTEKNIEKMTIDFKELGFDFDWKNGIQTHKFEYYKFEQEFFRKCWDAGLIYKKEKFVNYDPIDNTVLSNEQVINGKGWRSGADVIKKKIPMFFFDIKRYAKELTVEVNEWPKKVTEMQKNWIGFQEGETFDFSFNGSIAKIFKPNSIECQSVMVGINNQFIQDAVVSPKFNAWVEENTKGSVSNKSNFSKKIWFHTEFFIEIENIKYPIIVDLNRDEDFIFSKDKIDNFDFKTVGVFRKSYESENSTLKDWCISRQRYWGNPIPIIDCHNCGDVINPDNVRLPENLKPVETGNILSTDGSYHSINCPQCGATSKKCTDTMDTFVQSSWYYQKYIDPTSPEMIPKTDTQVDIYIGGIEHATMHLIYARVFHKMLRDFGMVNTNEPIKKLITQGMVCKKYKNSEGKIVSSKMSKSLGNIVAPKEYLEKYGADAIQMFMIFAAPPSDNFDFEDAGIVGSFNFLEDIYNYFFQENKSEKIYDETVTYADMQNTAKEIDIEFDGRGKLNTIIPKLMIIFKKIKKTNFNDIKIKEDVEKMFMNYVGIFTPHIEDYVNDFYFNKDYKKKCNI